MLVLDDVKTHLAAFLPPHIPYLPSSHRPVSDEKLKFIHPKKKKKMNTLIHCGVPYPFSSPLLTKNTNLVRFHSPVLRTLSARATSDETDTQTVNEELTVEPNTIEGSTSTSFSSPIDKELKKVGSLYPP